MMRYVITVCYRDLKESDSHPLPPKEGLIKYCAALSKRPDIESVFATVVNETNAGIWREGKKS
jgi:hypothetical protein